MWKLRAVPLETRVGLPASLPKVSTLDPQIGAPMYWRRRCARGEAAVPPLSDRRAIAQIGFPFSRNDQCFREPLSLNYGM